MTISELENRINLLSLIERDYKVKRVGSTYRINPCPICGNKDHFTVYPKTNSYSSFNDCCQGGSVYKYLQEVKGMDEERAYEELLLLAGEEQEYKKGTATPQPTKAEVKEVPSSNYTNIILKLYNEQSEKDKEYFINRGIGPEIIEKYKLCIGDVKELEQSYWGKRAIIPIWEGDKVVYWNARSLEENPKMKYMKPKGKSVLLNRRYLKNSNEKETIIITEGEFDALSIETLGFKAIALGGSENTDKLTNEIRSNKAAKNHIYIISFDSDQAGEKAAEKLQQDLNKLNIINIVYNLNGKYKDINEHLQKNKQQLNSLVSQAKKQALQEATKELEEYLKTSTKHHIDSFKDGINKSVDTPAISTGFKNFDDILDGGLYEGLYILGAISSLGKTTFVMQMADQIAQRGQDVLIFSLEMARTELMAKSISRLTLLNTENEKYAKTTRGITTGKRYFDYCKEEIELINKAISDYERYSNHIYISEGIGNIGVREIKAAVEKHIRLTGNKPVVIIDYLQILAPADPRATDKQNTDTAVLELKRISRDYKLPVVAISSFNRENYKAGVSMTAFKESGAIEYSSDVLIGLQFYGQGEKDFDVDEAKKKRAREIELKILKNRNGKTGVVAHYSYYALFNYYKEDNFDYHITIEGDKNVRRI